MAANLSAVTKQPTLRRAGERMANTAEDDICCDAATNPSSYYGLRFLFCLILKLTKHSLCHSAIVHLFLRKSWCQLNPPQRSATQRPSFPDQSDGFGQLPALHICCTVLRIAPVMDGRRLHDSVASSSGQLTAHRPF